MDVLSREVFAELLAPVDTAALSIYLPIETYGDGSRALLSFRSAVREARSLLSEAGGDTGDVARVVDPLDDLADDPAWWGPGDPGVCVFSSPRMFRALRLPASFEPIVVLQESFRLSPLVPLLGSVDDFHVLALSQKKVRVLACTRFEVEELDLGGAIPAGLEEALPFDDPEAQLQHHQSGAGAGGNAIFHGHGAGKDTKSVRLGRFHRLVDDGLGTLIDRRRPLVLAGVGSGVSSFRSVSHHPNIVDGFVSGNPDHAAAAELHRSALPLVEPAFASERLALADIFRTGRRPRAATLEELVSVAQTGRVDVVLIEEPTLQAMATTAGDSGLDGALAATWHNGGRVIAVEHGSLGEASGLGALLRY